MPEPLLVKLDEALSPTLIPVLEAKGYRVATIRSQGWVGRSDDEIWPDIQAEGAMLITPDKGFGDLRRFPVGSHHGVILLRPNRESAEEIIALLQTLLRIHSLDDLRSCLTVVSEGNIRIRHPIP